MEWIVTDNVYGETWRRLLEFTNVELTFDEIARRHGAPLSKSDRSNYKKQSLQVRVALLQAKEYFDASLNSTLFTSPNHLYYGMSSLATAMMLLLGDGNRSLDYLRRDSKNTHHGLRFSTGSTASDAATAMNLVENSFVQVLTDGHFGNWYSTLPSVESASAYVTREVKGGSTQNREYPGERVVPKLHELSGKKFSTIEILKCFPDLCQELPRYGVEIASARTTHRIHVFRDGKMSHTWLIHETRNPREMELLLDKFKVPPRLVDGVSVNVQPGQRGGSVTVETRPPGPVEIEYPDSRDTLNHDSISYAEGFVASEIAENYLVAFQLSMLSRYFPDLWIGCLESQCRAAKLIELSVSTMRKKFPILALSMLSPRGIVVSTHREPWKTL